MLESSLEFYRCPRTGARLALAEVAERALGEIRAATLRAEQGGAEYPVREGIVYLLPDEGRIGVVKLRERRGWVEMAKERERGPDRDLELQRLPYLADLDRKPHWRQAAMSFPVAEALLAESGPLAGKRILDVGAWIGWAARQFAEAGAVCVAADFNDDPEHGLGKADLFLSAGAPHFERLCADAEFLPLADASFDAAFCCATIHHFERPGALLRQIARVLKPGGRFVAINEAFRPLLRGGEGYLESSEQTALHLSHGINEQVFTHGEYRKFFEEAGLRFRAIHPRWDAARGEDGKLRVGSGLGLKARGFEISDGHRSRLRAWASRLGVERALRMPAVAALARPALFHFTGSFRILAGDKPA